MRIAIIGKYPPIQGGTSRQTYLAAHQLARLGHEVLIITNANEVELPCRQMFIGSDEARLEGSYQAGSVRVFNTTGMDRNAYIPWAQPYASKLFGLGLEVLTSLPCGLIVGWYFEPYGLVAAQLAQVLRLPLILRHAGSDIGRLANHPNLGPAYKWSLSVADKILTSAETVPSLVAMGARKEACHITRGSRIPDYFSRQAPALDLSLVANAAREWYAAMGLGRVATSVLQRGLDTATSLPRELPTIGIYGKVGRSKGSYDLLDSLEQLLESGVDFRFLAISGGQPELFETYLRYLGKKPALQQRTLTLPFVAQWRVPSFLRLCDLACFLERDFAIGLHNPKIAREILASGTTLVCSGEIADKQYYFGSLVDRQNYLRVEDPKNHLSMQEALKFGLQNDDVRRDIAIRGMLLARHLNDGIAPIDGYADAIERVGRDILG